MERWQGKVAVVTGASAGIGAAVADALARAGLTVVGLSRRPTSEETQEQVTSGGRLVPRGCDVSKPQDIEETFSWIEEKFGGVDILVNNAGVIYHGQITDFGPNVITEDNITSLLDVNIRGVILCTRRAVASMKKRNFNGHVININSIAGHYIPFASVLNVYTSTKHAVTAFTQALAVELAEFGQNIKTTSISPGLVATKMAETDVVRDTVDKLPKLQPSDIADAVVYALSTPPNVNISELTINHVGEKRI